MFKISIPKKQGDGPWGWKKLNEEFHTAKSAKLRLKTLGVTSGLIHTPEGEEIKFTPYAGQEE